MKAEIEVVKKDCFETGKMGCSTQGEKAARDKGYQLK